MAQRITEPGKFHSGHLQQTGEPEKSRVAQSKKLEGSVLDISDAAPRPRPKPESTPGGLLVKPKSKDQRTWSLYPTIVTAENTSART